ncbi:MAG: glycosyltransferase family 9 protein [Saprospiraceae bacterium]
MKKILIIQTAFIGDVILATGLAERLHAVFPEARIDFLLRKGNEGLLKDHPFLHTVWVWDKIGGKYPALLRLWRQVSRERYDLVVNLQRFFATGLLTALSGATHRAGFDKNPLSFAFTHRAAHLLGEVHEVDRNHSLIEPWAGPGASRPRLYPAPKDYEGIPQGPYVCLAPTSVWFTKQWPAENWTRLIDRLPAGWTVVLLGGPPDREACERIAAGSQHSHILNQCGKLGFLQSAAWMAGARMNYVNDSAPLHMASAMNAPVTAVFCSTTPAFGFTPLSSRSWVVETSLELPCRPCGLHGKKACPEGHFRCAEIEVEKLLAPLSEP